MTKAELEAENKELKKKLREAMKKSNESSVGDLPEEIWGVYKYNKEGDPYTHYKLVKVNFNYETKEAQVTDEFNREYVDVYTAIGKIREFNSTHIMQVAQGRK